MTEVCSVTAIVTVPVFSVALVPLAGEVTVIVNVLPEAMVCPCDTPETLAEPVVESESIESGYDEALVTVTVVVVSAAATVVLLQPPVSYCFALVALTVRVLLLAETEPAAPSVLSVDVTTVYEYVSLPLIHAPLPLATEAAFAVVIMRPKLPPFKKPNEGNTPNTITTASSNARFFFIRSLNIVSSSCRMLPNRAIIYLK